MSVNECEGCKQLCLEHNHSLACRTGTEASARNPMWTETGIQQTSFAPKLCRKVSELTRTLFDSCDPDSKSFICEALSGRGSKPDLKGFSGFKLIQGAYTPELQGRSRMLLYATEVAALGGICPGFPQLIGSHAAIMPQDTLAAHHTLLPQGANNPGVVFDWHTDTAQENDSSDRGSGKALLTAIHLIWTSSDYAMPGMEVLGKLHAVVYMYPEVGDTMVFSAHCVHKSIAPETGQCIKQATMYTRKTALLVSLQHNKAAKLFQATQYGVDTQPSADLACMIYGVLRNVNTMHECTARAYNFMLLMAAGAMSVASSLLVPSLAHPEDASMTQAKVDSLITSTMTALGSEADKHALVGCSRCAHRRAPILIG